MREFKKEKDKLISDLETEISNNPKDETLRSLHQLFLSLNSPKQLNDLFSGKEENENFLSILDTQIVKNPKIQTYKSLQEYMQSLNLERNLSGVLSRVVVDSLDYKFKIGERIIEFDKYFSDPSNSIISTDLKKLAKYLMKRDYKITFWGTAWSENNTDWVYFDKKLDLKKLRIKMEFREHIIEHQNLDNKSGLESGFIDQKTGEGIMGNLN
ncbi:hypothetical protein BC962_3297 [Gillisia mitskevichiae]|uniref:Uncharacterized protein n=1 Tax=Gillisia mitskevichiae TaxID=270921 RepID=A0A495NWP9_9FLAO|nr:hypothetical protein [Gillisia mitskevichiae]RKS42483.1 hypothetical protein BC962_3297 [Gillisia mitskevichiae]